MFFRGSRYETVPEGVYVDAKGRQIPYKLLRIITAAPALQTHPVGPLDRLDMIAFRYYDDPEQFWRICDAHLALLPDELLREPGRRLLIPLVQR
jgi:hypothetical protein